MGASSTDGPLGGDQGQQQKSELGPQDGQIQRQRRPRQSFLPPEMMEILVPSLKAGIGAGKSFTKWTICSLLLPSLTLRVGAGGLFVGCVGGIAAGQPVGLFAVASGFQWFTLGSSYYGQFHLGHERYA
jgi:hypothetical protein